MTRGEDILHCNGLQKQEGVTFVEFIVCLVFLNKMLRHCHVFKICVSFRCVFVSACDRGEDGVTCNRFQKQEGVAIKGQVAEHLSTVFLLIVLVAPVAVHVRTSQAVQSGKTRGQALRSLGSQPGGMGGHLWMPSRPKQSLFGTQKCSPVRRWGSAEQTEPRKPNIRARTLRT